MEEVKQYEPGEVLTPGKKYIKDNIEFTYKSDNEYVLNNGIVLDHIPTISDTRENNLVNLAHRTTEEQRKIATMGGKKSGEVRRAKKTLADRLRIMAELKASQSNIEAMDPGIYAGLTEEEKQTLTNADLIAAKITELAIAGSKDHQILYRDTIGEKPTDKVQSDVNVMTEGDRLLIEKISARLTTNNIIDI